MIFKDLLQEIVESTDGAVAATLMDYDGIQVADHIKESTDQDVQSVAVEFSKILRDCDQQCQQVLSGSLSQLSFLTPDYQVVFHAISQEYFICLLLNHSSNYGKARYLLRKFQPKFIEQL